jgi:hypothetical protein
MRRNDYYAKGGTVAPTHVKKELAFMKAKGAPAGMLKAEKKEHGMAGGAKGKFKFAEGGVTEGPNANIDDDTRARAMEFVRKRMAAQAAQPTVRVPPIKRRPSPPPEVSAATDDDASDRRMRRAVAQNEDFEGRGKPAPPVSSDDDASDRRMARAAAQNYGNEGRDKTAFADGGVTPAPGMQARPMPPMAQPKMGVPMARPMPQPAPGMARPQVGSFDPGMARQGGMAPPTQAGMQQAMQARQQAAQAPQARPMPQQAQTPAQVPMAAQQAVQARQQAAQAGMPARPGLQGMAKGGCVKR